MVQDILTYLTIIIALGVALYRLIRFFIRTAKGENPGCSSCALHNMHPPGKADMPLSGIHIIYQKKASD